MISVRRVAIALVFALALGGAARADAGGSDAKKMFDAGTAAYGLGRYAEAAADFEKAYELKPDPALLFNAAQAHRAAGNKERALLLYRNYLRVYAGRVGNEDEVRRVIAQLEAERKPPAPAPPVSPPPSSPPVALTPSPAPSPSAEAALVARPPARPVYKRQWFWVVVGGGAAVVAGAIALGVVYGSSTRNPTPTLGTWSY